MRYVYILTSEQTATPACGGGPPPSAPPPRHGFTLVSGLKATHDGMAMSEDHPTTPKGDYPPDAAARPSLRRLKRVGLAAAAMLVSVNIWTGAPLLAVWIGSRVVPQSGLSMGAVFVVLLVLAGSVIGLVVALGWITARYDVVAGRPAAQRRTSPWLRSMRGEREAIEKERHGVGTIERIVTISVVSAVLVFEVWFFFFARTGIPNA
jgi:hypothetical protein